MEGLLFPGEFIADAWGGGRIGHDGYGQRDI